LGHSLVVYPIIRDPFGRPRSDPLGRPDGIRLAALVMIL